MNTHPSIPPLTQFRTSKLVPSEYRTIWRWTCYRVAAFVIVASVACGGGGTGGDATVTGPPPATNLSFNLQQVNGQNLPATFQPVDGKLVITSGTMLLRTDKSFAENIIYTFTATGAASAVDTAVTLGTYVQTGSDLKFTVPPAGSDAGSVFSGTVSGNTLSYNDAGFVAVYLR